MFGENNYIFLGTLDTKELTLAWESVNPLQVNEFIMPEYRLVNFSTTEAFACYGDTFPSPREFPNLRELSSDPGGCSENINGSRKENQNEMYQILIIDLFQKTTALSF